MAKSAPATLSSAFGPIISKMTNPIPADGFNAGQQAGHTLSYQESNGLVHVSTPLLLVTAIPLILMAIIGHRIDYGLAESLGVGVVRSFLQLMMLGVILHPIFKWGMEMPWVVGLYVLAMILIATNEAISRPKYSFAYHPLLTFATLLISMSFVCIFAFGVILRPYPLWNPQYIIPLCGMLLGNTINGTSLSVTNLTTQIMEGGRREVELCLSFGASSLESIKRLMKDAISVGVTPMINQLNVIGLVSIPGMMTGQILGGSPVTEAARYQVLIIWLISIVMFSTVFMNAFVVYKVAFESGKHMLRTDRFIEVVKNKKRKGLGWNRIVDSFRGLLGAMSSVVRLVIGCGRDRLSTGDSVGVTDIEQQPFFSSEGYGTSKKCNLEIRTRNNKATAEILVEISGLQFSVPRTHTKRADNVRNTSSVHPSSSSSTSLNSLSQTEQQRILCEGLNFSLCKGGIGVVRGPSGSGKSTLLRVLSGLSSMDKGDVTADGLSLSTCDMTRWRSMVRYVTQYKVDIPGTPRDFIKRLSKFHSLATERDAGDDNIAQTAGSPMEADMIQQTISYIERWGMKSPNEHGGDHHIDKEWKVLSGGECQRMLLAIALASRPRVVLLDEATSGLDAESERKVEESVLEYVKTWDAAVLWVTHSDEIAERLLQ
ncbi:hypothetical protein HJC23_001106 [Cyclotella cryptica]|uniref:ABC transporter domain-containing protein n=1 Tax=Cyclotella cryptica TaxID=29204 RepID=A0ABD3QIM8_9STRA|eukprot:CCRYP_005093-RA/>CCRYP_005093-RA protein AED:0.04 eAED:0.04 QI:432/1/1/1/1/1/4/606/655